MYEHIIVLTEITDTCRSYIVLFIICGKSAPFRQKNVDSSRTVSTGALWTSTKRRSKPSGVACAAFLSSWPGVLCQLRWALCISTSITLSMSNNVINSSLCRNHCDALCRHQRLHIRLQALQSRRVCPHCTSPPHAGAPSGHRNSASEGVLPARRRKFSSAERRERGLSAFQSHSDGAPAWQHKHHLLEIHTFAPSPKTSPPHEDYSVSRFFYQKIIDKV